MMMKLLTLKHSHQETELQGYGNFYLYNIFLLPCVIVLKERKHIFFI